MSHFVRKRLARTMPFLRMYRDVHDGEKRATLEEGECSALGARQREREISSIGKRGEKK